MYKKIIRVVRRRGWDAVRKKGERRGIVFFAVGERYVRVAIAAAIRSASRNDVPHYVFSSVAVNVDHPQITVITYNEGKEKYDKADRIAMLSQAPLDKIIYLDADCGVLDNIEELFHLLEVYDIAVAHAPGYRTRNDPMVPDSFFEMNTGVIVYNNNKITRRIFKKWKDYLLTWREHPPFKGATPMDQTPFRRVIWEEAVPVYILGPEYNWRPFMPSFACSKIKIAQCYSDNYEELERLGNTSISARTFSSIPHAYQTLDSVPHDPEQNRN